MLPAKRIYLNVAFADKDKVQAAGAWWDAEQRGWYIDTNRNREPFRQWLPRRYRPGSKPPHVTADLIPQPLWYTNLRSLLPKEDWDRLRQSCFESAGYRCRVCGEKGPNWPVECNEQWTYRQTEEGNGVQSLLRLTALCPDCHGMKHLGKAQVDGTFDRVFEHMQNVNGWTEDQADDYVAEAFEIWERRSDLSWSLDLSVLPSWGIDAIRVARHNLADLPPIDGVAISVLVNASHEFNEAAFKGIDFQDPLPFFA